MSVVTMTSRGVRSTRRAAPVSTVQEASEFQGFWLNFGIEMPNGKVIRLNRGAAIDDLMTSVVYENTDPERAKEILLLNRVVKALRRLSNPKRMAEGEQILFPNLVAFLYRKQEGSTIEDSKADIDDMEAFLTGAGDYNGDEDAPQTKVSHSSVQQDEDEDLLGRTKKAR